LKKVVLWIALLFVMTNLSFAADQKLDKKSVYKLQVACEKDAKELFHEWYQYSSWKTQYGEGLGAVHTVTFKSHYNIKLEQCFILTTELIKYKGRPHKYITKRLADVSASSINNDEQLGYLHCDEKIGIIENNIFCNVGDKTCKSKKQWDLLAKPYMEE